MVVRQDLRMQYQELQSVSVAASPTEISCCGGSSTLSTTAYFKLITKTEDDTTTADTETNAAVTASYSDDKSYTTIEGNKITFDKNAINYPTTSKADARDSIVTGSYTYSGVNKTNTVTVTQSENNVGGWVWISDTTTSISVSPSSMYFESGGGTKDYSVTRYYNSYYEKYDSCNAKMDSKTDANSVAVTPSASCTGDFECTSSNVSIGVNEGSDRSGTLTVSYDGYTDTCSLSQGASQAGTYTSDPTIIGYSYYIQFSWDIIVCSGGTAQYLAKLLETYSYTVTEKDHDGSIISEEMKFGVNTYDKTNESDWTISDGTIENGYITISEPNPSEETKVITGTASWSGYSDTFDTEQEGGCVSDKPEAPVLTSLSLTNNLPGEFKVQDPNSTNIETVSASGKSKTSFSTVLTNGGAIDVYVPKSSMLKADGGLCGSCQIAISISPSNYEIKATVGNFKDQAGEIWWMPNEKNYNEGTQQTITIYSGSKEVYVSINIGD